MAVLMTVAMMLMADSTPPVKRGQDVLNTVRACGSVTPDDQRLSCYDRAAKALESAIADRTVAVVDSETVRRTQRSLFGFTMPRLSIFGPGKAGDRHDDEITEMRGVVSGTRSIGPDRFEIRLEDDAVWKNTDAFRRPPRTGDTVTIVKAAFGSYFMTVGDGRIGTRCMRAR